MSLIVHDWEPLVSVIIPTYNHARFLTEALGAVKAQTLTDWEAIIVDNHSEDDTASVIESMHDPRISHVLIHNQGIISASRNLGMSLAKGRYIAFLDSDDVWRPEKLELCVTRLELGYDVVCHGERWVSDKNIRHVVYGPDRNARYDRLLFVGNCLSTSAVVMRRSLIDKAGVFAVNEEFITAEDYEYWMRLSRVGAGISFLIEILGDYRIHSGNQMRAVLRNMQAVKAVVEHHVAELSERSPLTAIRLRRRLGSVYYSGARGLQDRGQYREAWPWFWKTLSMWPFSAKYYLAMLFNAFGRSVRR
jgi:glycosyltransferase involved in cell wall biosynthesis